ncbi:ankyrin repeat-containing domain protein [Xylaria cf. heliscus]|nr:ankyrin repeat-containing domain protein [Xylaria cf. heliscus]
MTSLQIAADFGDEGLIRCLLEEGHDPNVVGASFCTPLCLAVHWGSRSMIETLLDHGAHIELPCRNGETPLLDALKRDSTEMLQLLLERGGDCNYKTSQGKTLLHDAISAQNIEAARVLLRSKADPNIPDKFGVTPLFQSVVDQHDSFVDLLLENGADPNAMVTMKQTSLVTSPGSDGSSNGDDSDNVLIRTTTVVPVRAGSHSDEADVTHTPISWAVIQGYEGVLQSLLSACDRVTWKDHDGESLLHYAVRRNDNGIVRILLEKGPKELRDSTNSIGETQLHTAAEVGNMAAAAMLVDAGCQIDHRSCSESTPLTTALFRGNLEVANLLLEHGADRSIADEFVRGQLDGQYCMLHVGPRNAPGVPAMLAALPRLSLQLETECKNPVKESTLWWGVIGNVFWLVLKIYVLSFIVRTWFDI